MTSTDVVLGTYRAGSSRWTRTRPEHAYTQGGDAYTPVSAEVIVEVVAGTIRHAVVTVVRLR
ncbi:hypothetical protein ABZ656_39940 [Streptomyces sp. NPDC007095]|uniref:hypothetical protein n=1 Tax=Streptomyces sp. NPDC007095 TaxID=3154482 RepID=UPI0033C886E4